MPRLTDPAAGPSHDGESTDAAHLIACLAAVTAARLRLADPPLGDDQPAALGALPLAVAVAVHEAPSGLTEALDLIEAPSSARDLLARHGLVARVMDADDGPRSPVLRAELARHSPLTALFGEPPDADMAPYTSLLNRLRRHGDGRQLATSALAEPPVSPVAARRRGELLGRYRYRPEDRQWLYDVYETALLTHGPYWLHHTHTATAALTGTWRSRGADEDEEQFAWAEALAVWWRPLAVLVHRHPDELRARGMLRGYEPGVALSRIHTRAQARAGLEALLVP
ncbi:hypothetical protein ACWEQ7_30365 [Streptomyces sp. NPDC004069]